MDIGKQVFLFNFHPESQILAGYPHFKILSSYSERGEACIKKYSDENRLILLCFRTDTDDRSKDETEILLNSNLDWDYILSLSRKEDISSLLYHRFFKYQSKIPDRIYSQLKKDYFNATALNILFNKEFHEILTHFKEAKVTIIPLKGIALIQGIYHDAGLRRMGDIDLLVKIEDLPAAERILKGIGYNCLYENNGHPASYSPYLNSNTYKKTGEITTVIHLHWHIVNTTLPLLSIYRINIEEIFADAIIEKEMLMMSPEHLLLYLSMHALHHYFKRLILLCDIQGVLEFYRDRLDWDKLIRIAQSYNLSRPLYYSLYLGSEILGFILPRGILTRLRPADISYGERRFVSSILKFDNKACNSSYPVYLSMAGGFFQKIKFIWLTLFPPTYYLCQIKQIKPEDVGIMYYFKRIIQGLRQGVVTQKV